MNDLLVCATVLTGDISQLHGLTGLFLKENAGGFRLSAVCVHANICAKKNFQSLPARAREIFIVVAQ